MQSVGILEPGHGLQEPVGAGIVPPESDEASGSDTVAHEVRTSVSTCDDGANTVSLVST
jgi:hypothetical protein